jgi:hypothetical protein
MERIEAEKTKPLGKQDYGAIKSELTEIANDKSEEAKEAARYAKHVLKKVEATSWSWQYLKGCSCSRSNWIARWQG